VLIICSILCDVGSTCVYGACILTTCNTDDGVDNDDDDDDDVCPTSINTPIAAIIEGWLILSFMVNVSSSSCKGVSGQNVTLSPSS